MKTYAVQFEKCTEIETHQKKSIKKSNERVNINLKTTCHRYEEIKVQNTRIQNVDIYQKTNELFPTK